MAIIICSDCNNEMSDQASNCPKCGKPTKRSVGFLLGLGILLIPIIFVWFTLRKGHSTLARIISFSYLALGISMALSMPDSEQIMQVDIDKDTAYSSNKVETEGLVSIEKYNWRTGGFGNILEADFTIKNDSQHTIKDIEITCKHYAKSGTEIDSNTRTIYDKVKTKDKKTFYKFNMGFIHDQVEKSGCIISNYEII